MAIDFFEITISVRMRTPRALRRYLEQAFAEFADKYTPEALEVVTPPADEIRNRFKEGPVWVALRNKVVIGTVSVVPEPEWLYLRSMAVSPNQQGLGIGGMLLETVESYAVAQGFKKLFLYTTPFSVDAIRLYEKHGFVRGRDTAADEWFGTPGLEMMKSLDRKSKTNATGS